MGLFTHDDPFVSIGQGGIDDLVHKMESLITY